MKGMDLYLKPKPRDNGEFNSGGIASFLQKAKEASKGPSSSKSMSTSWDERLRDQNGVSMADVFAANRSESGKKLEKGWRIKGGRKIYGTWRNGKWIEAEGAEAMKLAIGDGFLPQSKQKTGATEDTNTTTKKRKIGDEKENNGSRTKKNA